MGRAGVFFSRGGPGEGVVSLRPFVCSSQLAGDRRARQSTWRAGSGVIWNGIPFHTQVIPAKAGIHSQNLRRCAVYGVDSRFRGNDCGFECACLSNGTSTGGQAATSVFLLTSFSKDARRIGHSAQSTQEGRPRIPQQDLAQP